MKPCVAESCPDNAVARNMCDKHWKRWRIGKDINKKSRFDKTSKERFFEKVNMNTSNGCWLWTGGTRGRGTLQYGSAWHQGKNVGAHRLSWIFCNGFLPSHLGLNKAEVCHKCDTPLCVNPDHLFIGTRSDNMQDKIKKGRCGQKSKTHCPSGHKYSESNTYVSKSGSRSCRICHRLLEGNRRTKLKEYN